MLGHDNKSTIKDNIIQVTIKSQASDNRGKERTTKQWESEISWAQISQLLTWEKPEAKATEMSRLPPACKHFLMAVD